ncbi:MAG: shewanella-like protein phosphatase, partial [Polyangiales bacterium]
TEGRAERLQKQPERPSQPPAAATTHDYERSAPGLVVAIGDMHGDLAVARRALRLAGVIDEHDHWAGGDRVAVVTGDTIDRGDDDKAVVDLLERLRTEAAEGGGAFIPLVGNHEIMNVEGDLRYVTPKSAAAFEQGRVEAFKPGGEYAKVLAHWPVIVKVNDSVFVHGGVLKAHLEYGIDELNTKTAAWMRDERGIPSLLLSDTAPVWTRLYSVDPDDAACAELDEVLHTLGAKRMIVGHTPQLHGISSACHDHVWRIDTGMSHFYGGPVQVLAIGEHGPQARSE